IALFLNRLVEGLVKEGDAVPERILQADYHGGFEAHGGGFFDNVQEPDGTSVGQRLNLDEPTGIDGKVVRDPAFKTVVFFGLCGRTVGCGFWLQFIWNVTDRG